MKRFRLAAAQLSSVPGDVVTNLHWHLEFAQLAAEHGAQLLMFPELSLTGYELELANSCVVCPEDAVLRPLRDIAGRASMSVVVGAPLSDGGGGLHIGAIVFAADGSVTTYRKQHVHASEQPVFASGPGGSMLRVAGRQVGLAICADATFPSHAATAAASGAEVYAVGAMIDEAGYKRKSALLRRYAEEHRMAVLLANYSGVTGGEVSSGKSAVWSEEGRVVAEVPGAEEALVIATKEHGVWSGAVVPVLGVKA